MILYKNRQIKDVVITAFDLNKDVILTMQQKRRDERGGFEGQIKLLWTD